jgi:hypothetical protein
MVWPCGVVLTHILAQAGYRINPMYVGWSQHKFEALAGNPRRGLTVAARFNNFKIAGDHAAVTNSNGFS